MYLARDWMCTTTLDVKVSHFVCPTIHHEVLRCFLHHCFWETTVIYWMTTRVLVNIWLMLSFFWLGQSQFTGKLSLLSTHGLSIQPTDTTSCLFSGALRYSVDACVWVSGLMVELHPQSCICASSLFSVVEFQDNFFTFSPTLVIISLSVTYTHIHTHSLYICT